MNCHKCHGTLREFEAIGCAAIGCPLNAAMQPAPSATPLSEFIAAQQEPDDDLRRAAAQAVKELGSPLGDKRSGETPRTNRLVQSMLYNGELVPSKLADHADQLERELAVANTLLGTLKVENVKLRWAAQSATATPFVDPGEEYDGWAEKEKAEELLREIVQMTDNAGIQRKIADYFKATKL